MVELLQVLCIRKPEEAIDLFMVEIMHMRHKFDVDTRLVCLINDDNFFWMENVLLENPKGYRMIKYICIPRTKDSRSDHHLALMRIRVIT